MPADVCKRDQAGVALRHVQPIPHPRIGGHVGFPAHPDVHAINRVEQHRQENDGPLDNGPERNGLQISRNFVVFRGVYEGGAVRPEVFRQKRSNRKYAGKGMKLSEKVTRIRLAYGGRHALSAAGFLASSRSTNRKREKNRGSLQYRQMHRSMQGSRADGTVFADNRKPEFHDRRPAFDSNFGAARHPIIFAGITSAETHRSSLEKILERADSFERRGDPSPPQTRNVGKRGARMSRRSILATCWRSSKGLREAREALRERVAPPNARTGVHNPASRTNASIEMD